MGSPDAIKSLLGGAAGKLASTGAARVDRIRSDLGVLIDLVRQWASGEYDQVSKGSIVTIVAAILYFLVPLDLIPDFLLGFGFIDDVAVVGYVLNVLRAEIDAFERWRDGSSVCTGEQIEDRSEHPPDSPDESRDNSRDDSHQSDEEDP